MQKTKPEQDELVLATVKKILPYGAFCSLDEYEKLEGFLHVSEVAPRWIKNIHEFLKDGQKIVAKVHRLIPEKGQIDLSLKRVTEAERKRKLELYKREKRGYKLFELAAHKMKKDLKKAWEEVGQPLEKEFGDIYTALEEFSFNKEEFISRAKLAKEWSQVLEEIATQNIKKPKLTIKGVFKIECFLSDGINIIKEAFKKASETKYHSDEIKFIYLGAPRYMVEVTAEDYKLAEKTMDEINNNLTSSLKNKKCTISFERLKAS